MKTKITAEAFVEIWQKAENIKDVSAATGINITALRARAAYYRGKGIKLKKFGYYWSFDEKRISALKAIAEKYAPK